MGNLAAIGCIADSCRHCEYCYEGLEPFCDEGVTYSFNSADKHIGGATFGGFSKTYVCDEQYVLQMPEFDDVQLNLSGNLQQFGIFQSLEIVDGGVAVNQL
jgi:alcohol dehydrogenase (NADP+)